MGNVTEALALLNHFSTARGELPLDELAALSGLHEETVRQHLSELTASGFVQRDSRSRAFRVGPAVLRLAVVREATFPARRAVAPIVDALAAELGELVHVSMLQHDVMSPLYHANANAHPTRVSFDEAELLPMHATAAGLAMLAFGPPHVLEDAIAGPLARYTDATSTDAKTLLEVIERARAAGIASSDETFDAHVRSLAVPLYDNAGCDAVGTLAVAVPAARLDRAARERISAVLKHGGVSVSAELGGRVPERLLALWRESD